MCDSHVLQPTICVATCLQCRRWGDQHGDQARQLQAVQEARQQAENRVEELSTQLEQEQQQVAQHKDRYALQNQHVQTQGTILLKLQRLPASGCVAMRAVRQLWQQDLWQQHLWAVYHMCGYLQDH